MNYKKIIKSRALRLKLLELFCFIPDKSMLKFQYRIKTGHKLNLKNPKRFTEKLQWVKLYYKNPLMVKCVDKYDVREYVRQKGYADILIPCYGVFDNAMDINWNAIPNRFVVKDTLGGGGNSVIVFKDKEKIDFAELNKIMEEWTNTNHRKHNAGREWPYYAGKKHRIIIEEFLDADPNLGDLIDYKFMCLNGEIGCVYVLCDRNLAEGAQCGIFDADFNLLPYSENDEKPLKRAIQKPENYETMCEIAKDLSSDFIEARIDLYNLNGEIFFGEITFFDSSGYMVFDPDEFDYILGDKFRL